MKFELSNHLGTLSLSNNTLSLVASRGGGEVSLYGEEFVLFVRRDNEILPLLSSSFSSKIQKATPQAVEISYDLDGLGVLVTYSVSGDTFVKTLSIHSSNPLFLSSVVLEGRTPNTDRISLGGEGLPFFVNDVAFAGIEFPAADNRLDHGALDCRQHPNALLSSFVSLPVVYGLKKEGSLADTFRIYIENNAKNRKPRLRLYYGNWGLYDNLTPGDPIIDEALSLSSIKDLTYFEKASGCHFDAYIMDAFWFQKNSHYAEFDENVFPRGMKPVVDALEKEGIDFGLWFDLNFSKDEPQGYEFADNGLHNGSYCFACPELYERMESALLRHIKEEKVRVIKFDFAYFECFNSKHDHAQGLTPSKERSVSLFLRLLSKLYEVEPNLTILCYNGWTISLEYIGNVKEFTRPVISPYWSKYVDYVYCGDPRPSEIPTASFASSLTYYTDAMVNNFYDSFFPLSSIDDHGAMMGHTGTIYYLGNETYRQGVLMSMMRGGNKLHLYGDLSHLSKEDAEYFACVKTIGEEAIAQGMVFHPAFGDPRKGEPYGYVTGNEKEGYFVLVNPTDDLSSTVIELPEWKGKKVSLSLRIKNGKKASGEELAKGRTVVHLEKEEYALYHWVVVPSKNKETILTIHPGDELEVNVEGYEVLSIIFKNEKNEPIRTGTGVPDFMKITVESEKEPCSCLPCETVWSGLSWVRKDVKEAKRVRLSYLKGEPIFAKLVWEK
ncbi:MAG: hypothetical protein SPG64_05790 [Candidatus Enteromonas sp.]|nr:hypothetical protein [Candidatus Enteromonas sp.]